MEHGHELPGGSQPSPGSTSLFPQIATAGSVVVVVVSSGVVELVVSVVLVDEVLVVSLVLVDVDEDVEDEDVELVLVVCVVLVDDVVEVLVEDDVEVLLEDDVDVVLDVEDVLVVLLVDDVDVVLVECVVLVEGAWCSRRKRRGREGRAGRAVGRSWARILHAVAGALARDPATNRMRRARVAGNMIPLPDMQKPDRSRDIIPLVEQSRRRAGNPSDAAQAARPFPVRERAARRRAWGAGLYRRAVAAGVSSGTARPAARRASRRAGWRAVSAVLPAGS